MAEIFCLDCRYWLPIGNEIGQCKAHPPTPLFGALLNQPGSGVPKLQFYWPETAAKDWCGEFKSRGGIEQ
jgi:hypothetical protein